MNEHHASSFKIGLILIIGLVAIIGTLIYFGGLGNNANESLVETYYDKAVSGLSVGSSVNFRGVKMGEVRRISFIGADYPEATDSDRQKIRIVMAFDDRMMRHDNGSTTTEIINRLIKRGLRVTVTASGITGLSHIEVDFIQHPKDIEEISWKPKNVCIPPEVSLIDSFSDSATRVMHDLDSLDFRAACSNIFSIIIGVGNIVSNVNALAANANSLINEQRTGISNVVQNLQVLTAEAILTVSNATLTINSINEAVAANRPNLDTLMANLRTASERANDTLAKLDTIAADTSAIVKRNEPTLSNAIDNLDSAASAAQDLVEKLRTDPSLLLRANDPQPLPETRR